MALDGDSGRRHDLSRRRVASTHRYYVRQSQREEARALLILVVFVVALVGFQAFLVTCRKKHDALYIGVSLAGLWAIPALLAAWLMWPLMLLVWSAFTLVVGCVMFLATRRELAQATPRTVYAFFSAATRSCFGLGVVGYGLMLLDFLRLEELAGLRGYTGPLGGCLLCYGLYLGVLTRDCATLTSELMASRMGLAGGSRDEEESRKELPPDTCCVCGGGLADGMRGPAAEGGLPGGDGGDGGDDELSALLDPTTQRIENPFRGCLARARPEPIVALGCGHRYHEQCIRGWALIGKRDTCAYCCERVELKRVFPWERHSLLWLQLLDVIRYLIVWNPLIIVLVDAVLPLVAGRGGGSIGGY